MTPTETFQPEWWFRNPHLHTVWGQLVWGRRRVPYRRELLETPDGDELVLDHLDASHDAPRVLLLHGMEGSSSTGTMVVLAWAAWTRGWNVTALNFRSCARELEGPPRVRMNRRPRLYHAGDDADLQLVVDRLGPKEPVVAIGASLGANVLLKWLGENPGQTAIQAAAALSCPFDLARGARYLEETLGGRFYMARLLRGLRRKVRLFVGAFPDAPIDLPGGLRARTIRAFDDAVTAPLHGFRDSSDHHARCSSIRLLDRITTPTLCLSAEDDPFLPSSVLVDARAAASPAVRWVVTHRGGHLGFVTGPPWRTGSWAEGLVLKWLDGRL